MIDNYEGIEKIEWQGVGVEWRNSSIFGSSMFGNYVNSNVNVYVSEDNYFTIRFRLNDETEYDDDLKKYIALDSLNSSNTDVSIEVGIDNAIYNYSNDSNVENLEVVQEKKLELKKVKKNSTGSPNAEAIYNLKIHELRY